MYEKLKRFRTQVGRYGIGAVLHRLGISLINRLVPFRKFHLLVLTPHVAARINPPQVAGLVCREVHCSELLPFANDPLNGLRRDFLTRSESRNDICLAQFTLDGSLAAYCFYASKPTDIDPDYRFHFPDNKLYVYKAYTHPNWRGKGLNALGLVAGVRRFAHDPRTQGGFVALVQSNNFPSLVAFKRSGFVNKNTFRIIGARDQSLILGTGSLAKAGYAVERLKRHPES